MPVGASCRRVPGHDEVSAHHRHHRPGRLLSRRAAARARLRGARHGSPCVDREVRAHRASARAHHAASGRPARPALARRHAARRQARRGLQPRRDELRRGVLAAADADGGVHRRRRDAHARGRPRGLPGGALLPGLELGDVRQGARGPADGDDAVLPPLALRRGEGLRPLHHGQLPRVLRPLRVLGDPLQPRVRAPRPGVRDAQDHVARGRDQARPARRDRARQPRRRARLGLREGLRRGDVPHAPAGHARGLRHRDEQDAHRARLRPDRLRRGRASTTGSATCASTRRSCAPPRSTS